MAIACMAWLTLAGCRDATFEDTTLFQRAEEHYYQGDYDGALDLYQRYLELNPRSSLRELAEQRIASAQRELEVLYERRFSPPPNYVSPYRDLSESQPLPAPEEHE